MSVLPVSATAVVFVGVGGLFAIRIGVGLGVNKENGFCLLDVFSYKLAT
jgi:hypothetical protein